MPTGRIGRLLNAALTAPRRGGVGADDVGDDDVVEDLEVLEGAPLRPSGAGEALRTERSDVGDLQRLDVRAGRRVAVELEQRAGVEVVQEQSVATSIQARISCARAMSRSSSGSLRAA